MVRNLSRGVFQYAQPPRIISYASTVGQKEGDGPFGACFDCVEPDAHFGQDTWEQAESVMQRRTVQLGGTPFGVKMFTDGALVVAFSDIYTVHGSENPAKEAGLRTEESLRRAMEETLEALGNPPLPEKKAGKVPQRALKGPIIHLEDMPREDEEKKQAYKVYAVQERMPRCHAL